VKHDDSFFFSYIQYYHVHVCVSLHFVYGSTEAHLACYNK